MHVDIHAGLYPFYNTKKIPHITATLVLRWQQCFFFIQASFRTLVQNNDGQTAARVPHATRRHVWCDSLLNSSISN